MDWISVMDPAERSLKMTCDRRVEALKLAVAVGCAEGIAYPGSPTDFIVTLAARFDRFLEAGSSDAVSGGPG